ncbi:MAG: hypothetical protein LBC42_03735, partial [Puniceicoccales bacterium]|nr:hypothetical protein [Puniceicoccales bacterium]
MRKFQCHPLMFGFLRLWRRLAGRHYRKFFRHCEPLVRKINEFEKSYQALSDAELAGKTEEFRERVRGGESLDSLLPEAFAAIKNAARRLCGRILPVCGENLEWQMIPYDEQLIGGIA